MGETSHSSLSTGGKNGSFLPNEETATEIFKSFGPITKKVSNFRWISG